MIAHILLNPAGAGGAAHRRWSALESVARTVFPALELHRSSEPGALCRIAATLASSDGLLIAAGGDGTSHEVINGMLSAPSRAAAVGWLPLGSGNDLARSNGVPLDPIRAVESYRSWMPALIDAGRVDFRDAGAQAAHRYFGNSLTFGVSTDTLAIVLREGKPFGALSYFAATARALARHRPISVALDGTPAEVRLISITNGPTVGAGMRLAPMARLDDGRLDLVTVAAISRLSTGLVFPRVYWGGHLRHPAVSHRSVTTLRIDADGPLPFEADGELYLGYPPFEVTILPRALRVARPVAPPSTR